MKLASINVSAGKVVVWQGKQIETGIFKEPIEGPVMVRCLNIDGDRQSDLTVHGGEFKAVYAYSLQHYDWWRSQLARDLPFGMFGENLTVDGLSDQDICVGDVLKVGEALLEAVQPRFPCFKLGVRFSDPTMVKRFLDSERWGVYFRVLQEGVIAPGDEMSWVRHDPERFPVPDLIRLLSHPNAAQVARALSLAALPAQWANKFRETLQAGGEV